MKICSNKGCLEINPQSFTSFTKDPSKKSGLESYCKKCSNRKSEQWRRANLKRSNNSKKKCEIRNPDLYRNTQLKAKYGITLDFYNDLFDKQDGCCAGCKKHQSKLKRSLCVDHCHETGDIRGLLCHACNSALGHLYDNTEVLQNLIKYLENSRN